ARRRENEPDGKWMRLRRSCGRARRPAARRTGLLRSRADPRSPAAVPRLHLPGALRARLPIAVAPAGGVGSLLPRTGARPNHRVARARAGTAPGVIDSRHFRNLAGHFATGVAVVTAFDSARVPAGMTVNSFTSRSLEPPLVSVAIARDASAWEALSTAQQWTVNLLGADQEVIARRFAGVANGRFDGTQWSEVDGHLILHDTIAH